MAEQSSIEWTDATWNPITGCTLVSDGCRNCYAAELATTRLRNHPSRAGLARKNAAGEAKFTGEVRFNEQWLDQPLRWRRPRKIFVCAHSDLFHESVPNEWIDRVFAVMALAPQHTFQVLTKRPARAHEYLTADGGFGPWGRVEHHARHMAHIPPGKTLATYGGSNLPNVWLGTSIEDQRTVDERLPHLVAAPAAVHFVSYEPALGPADLAPWMHDSGCRFRAEGICTCCAPRETHLDWVITGGESGRHARPSHPDWFRRVRDDCAAAGVAYLHKQNGAWLAVEVGRDGEISPPIPMAGFSRTRRWDGTSFVSPGDDANVRDVFAPGSALTFPVGKAAAGRLLDGREHNDMPEARS
ncbi:MAG: phage Gp37/Gp68 family protein [Amaricoccus sp.]|uniref:DUF5131 family protein n=1 Tax=Amaricoccus sp. TaxID=1872485 RepID=UPI0039E31163